jgi:hypothetical protein
VLFYAILADAPHFRRTHLCPANDVAWAAHTATPRTAASAVVAAHLSDAEAEAIRLGCHDHRHRRGIWGWCRIFHSGVSKWTARTHECTGCHDHGEEMAPNDEPNEEPTEEPTAAGFTSRKSDFEIGIKIREKKCFGSVGCSATYRIKLKYVGT